MLAALNLHALLWWRTADAARMAHVARRQRHRRARPSCPGYRRSSTSRTTRSTPARARRRAWRWRRCRPTAAAWSHDDIVLRRWASSWCCLALLGLRAERRPRRLEPGRCLMWLVPLGLVLALGLRNGLFEVRYLVLSLPGMMLLAGAGHHPPHALAGPGRGLAALLVVPAVRRAHRPVLRPAARARRLPRPGRDDHR